MASVKLDLKLFKREISSSQQGKTNWAYAMGYPGSANTTNVGLYNAALYRKQANPTGCNAYYVGAKDDPVRGQGCWRLATIAENQASGGLILWCIEEADARNAYTAGANYFGSISKGSSYPYYCVLDVRPPELSDFIYRFDFVLPNHFKQVSHRCDTFLLVYHFTVQTQGIILRFQDEFTKKIYKNKDLFL